jgi:hypothetical protein
MTSGVIPEYAEVIIAGSNAGSNSASCFSSSESEGNCNTELVCGLSLARGLAEAIEPSTEMPRETSELASEATDRAGLAEAIEPSTEMPRETSELASEATDRAGLSGIGVGLPAIGSDAFSEPAAGPTAGSETDCWPAAETVGATSGARGPVRILRMTAPAAAECGASVTDSGARGRATSCDEADVAVAGCGGAAAAAAAAGAAADGAEAAGGTGLRAAWSGEDGAERGEAGSSADAADKSPYGAGAGTRAAEGAVVPTRGVAGALPGAGLRARGTGESRCVPVGGAEAAARCGAAAAADGEKAAAGSGSIISR